MHGATACAQLLTKYGNWRFLRTSTHFNAIGYKTMVGLCIFLLFRPAHFHRGSMHSIHTAIAEHTTVDYVHS